MSFRQAAVGLAAFFLWACGGTPTPTPVPPTSTSTPTRIPATFPPTWTPTFTPTAAPPTSTNTPSATVSPMPTLDPQQMARICETFGFDYAFDQGETFEPDDKIAFAVETQRWEVVVRFLAVHRLTGDNQGLQVPGGQHVLVEMPVSLLPHPGLYDWTVSIHHDVLGDFCTYRGYFFVREGPPAEATAEAEATEEAESDG